jgi:hypothetical protein
MTGGAGIGNKLSGGDDSSYDNSGTRFGSAGNTDSYIGSTDYGSGTTGGAGMGNKTSSGGKDDSTAGKLMEKAGNMLHSKGLAEKGLEKREQAGYDGGNNY